jgi:hypothetical protein
LHIHTDGAPSTFHHSADGGRRITTPGSGDVSESHVQHLSKTFPPLEFPPELALRILTHLSHRDSVIGHNLCFASVGLHLTFCFYKFLIRFAIAGWRTLDAYMLLFLQGLPAAAEHDHSRIAARVLNTHGLDEHVAHWRLQDVMRWNLPRAGDLGLDGKAAGLHKVAGTMVEAVVGGVLQQFVSHISGSLTPLKLELTDCYGGRIAHRLFHTRVLSHLLLPGSPFGLPDVLHADALKAAEHCIERFLKHPPYPTSAIQQPLSRQTSRPCGICCLSCTSRWHLRWVMVRVRTRCEKRHCSSCGGRAPAI